MWLVLSGGFLLYAYTPDPQIALIEWAAGQSAIGAAPGDPQEVARQAAEAYIQARNYDVPIWERYSKWMWNYLTLQWGWSFIANEPVSAVLAERGPRTLAYVLPAIICAVLGGVTFGVYGATHRGGILDRLGTAVAYTGYGIPSFFLAEIVLVVGIQEMGLLNLMWDSRWSAWSPKQLDAYIPPFIVLTVNMAVVQARYARAESLDFMPEQFVRTLRANGASVFDVARHVLRNASIPLVSLFFAETLTAMFVSVYVIEVVMNFPGLGAIFYEAIGDFDVGLILAQIFLPALLAIFGNFLQDVLYALLDPRIASGESNL